MIIRFPIERTMPPADRSRPCYANIDRYAVERGYQHNLHKYIKRLEQTLIRKGVIHVD